MITASQTIEGISLSFYFILLGEKKQREFLDKQLMAIEKCLTPVVQAYYSDYNNSLINLTAICDDFRKNQKEALVLAKRVEEVKIKLSSSHSGIEDLYYEKVCSISLCTDNVAADRVYTSFIKEYRIHPPISQNYRYIIG